MPIACLKVLLTDLATRINKEAMAKHLRMKNAGQLTEKEIPFYPPTGYNRSVGRLRLLTRKYSFIIPTKEQWERGEVKFELGFVVFYTGGEGLGVQERFVVGSHTTDFQAEICDIPSEANTDVARGGSKSSILNRIRTARML